MTNSKRAGIVIGFILFAIVVSGLYAIIYAAPRLEGIGIKTDVVQYDKMPIADEVTALFVRDETLYTASYSGNPEYMVEEGTKIRAGTQVVYISPASRIEEVPMSAGIGDDSDTGGAQAETDGTDAEEGAGASVETLLMEAGRDTVESEGGVSPWTAIVSYHGDGWEKKVTPDNIMSLPKSVFDKAPGEAIDLRREWVGAGEPVYRITNNNLWHIAFWIENADKTVLDKYKVGKKLYLDLGTTKVRASVEAAEARGRDLFVVMSSDEFYRDLDKYRKRDISVVFSEVSGAVIEKRTVKLKSGKAGVYVKQQGGSFKWVPVKVLKESGDRYLIAETSFEDSDGERTQTIRYYDEIMSNPAAQGY